MLPNPSKEGPDNKLSGLPKTRTASIRWNWDLLCNASFQLFPTDRQDLGSSSCGLESEYLFSITASRA